MLPFQKNKKHRKTSCCTEGLLKAHEARSDDPSFDMRFDTTLSSDAAVRFDDPFFDDPHAQQRHTIEHGMQKELKALRREELLSPSRRHKGMSHIMASPLEIFESMSMEGMEIQKLQDDARFEREEMFPQVVLKKMPQVKSSYQSIDKLPLNTLKESFLNSRDSICSTEILHKVTKNRENDVQKSASLQQSFMLKPPGRYSMRRAQRSVEPILSDNDGKKKMAMQKSTNFSNKGGGMIQP